MAWIADSAYCVLYQLIIYLYPIVYLKTSKYTILCSDFVCVSRDGYARGEQHRPDPPGPPLLRDPPPSLPKRRQRFATGRMGIRVLD